MISGVVLVRWRARRESGDTHSGQCQEKLAPLFVYEAGKSAILDAIYDRGGIEVDTLPTGEDVKKRIAVFPALRWKAQHLGLKPGI